MSKLYSGIKVSEQRCEDCLWHECGTGCQCKCHRPAALPSEPAAPKCPICASEDKRQFGLIECGPPHYAKPCNDSWHREEPAAKPEPPLTKYRNAIDAIYNSGKVGRELVIKHFGLWHPRLGRCDLNVLLHPHRVGTCQNWKPFMSAEEFSRKRFGWMPELDAQSCSLHDAFKLAEAYADARDKHNKK